MATVTIDIPPQLIIDLLKNATLPLRLPAYSEVALPLPDDTRVVAVDYRVFEGVLRLMIEGAFDVDYPQWQPGVLPFSVGLVEFDPNKDK